MIWLWVYLAGVLAVALFAATWPVDGTINVVAQIQGIWRGDKKAWGEIGGSLLVAAVWPVFVVAVIFLGVILHRQLKDG